MADIEDTRSEDVLTELHTIGTARYRIDPASGERVKIENGRDPMGFAYPTKDRISAMKVFLDFTKKKPTQGTTLDINAPEAFLEALVAQEEPDGEDDDKGPTGGPQEA